MRLLFLSNQEKKKTCDFATQTTLFSATLFIYESNEEFYPCKRVPIDHFPALCLISLPFSMLPAVARCSSFSCLSICVSISGLLSSCPAPWTWRISPWTFRRAPCSLRAVSRLLVFLSVLPLSCLCLSLFAWYTLWSVQLGEIGDTLYLHWRVNILCYWCYIHQSIYGGLVDLFLIASPESWLFFIKFCDARKSISFALSPLNHFKRLVSLSLKKSMGEKMGLLCCLNRSIFFPIESISSVEIITL